MLQKSPLKLVILLIAGILIGYFGQPALQKISSEQKAGGYMPACLVSGDVQNPFALRSDGTFAQVKFNYKGEYFQGIPLAGVVQQAEPLTSAFDILLVGSDGLSAEFSGDNLTGCHLAFTSQNGWEAININHPVSSNIKMLAEIIIMAREPLVEYGVNITTQTENLRTLMPGGIYRETMPIVPYYEGTSTVSHAGEEYSVSIYSRRKMFALRDLLQGQDVKRLIAMGRWGEYAYIDTSGYLQLTENRFDYVPANRKGGITDWPE